MKDRLINIICEVYGKKYVGYMTVKSLKPCGFDVALGLNKSERPIHIQAQMPDNEFVNFFREEIRSRHLSDVHFYEGYRLYDHLDGPTDKKKFENVDSLADRKDIRFVTSDGYVIQTNPHTEYTFLDSSDRITITGNGKAEDVPCHDVGIMAECYDGDTHRDLLISSDDKILKARSKVITTNEKNA